MGIIKANEYPRHRHRPPIKGIFNNKDIGKAEGNEQDPQEAELSLKRQAKALLATAVAAEAAAQEDAAADKEALAEEEAIRHDCEMEDEEREGCEMENELPEVN